MVWRCGGSCQSMQACRPNLAICAHALARAGYVPTEDESGEEEDEVRRSAAAVRALGH